MQAKKHERCFSPRHIPKQFCLKSGVRYTKQLGAISRTFCLWNAAGAVGDGKCIWGAAYFWCWYQHRSDEVRLFHVPPADEMPTEAAGFYKSDYGFRCGCCARQANRLDRLFYPLWRVSSANFLRRVAQLPVKRAHKTEDRMQNRYFNYIYARAGAYTFHK